MPHCMSKIETYLKVSYIKRSQILLFAFGFVGLIHTSTVPFVQGTEIFSFSLWPVYRLPTAIIVPAITVLIENNALI